MSENNPINVAIFENQELWIADLTEHLEELGCTVVAVAPTIVEALNNVIPQLSALGVQFALVDGNLSEDKGDGLEGKTIVDEIKKIAPSIKTIGISRGSQDYVDIQLGKKNYNPAKLKKALNL